MEHQNHDKVFFVNFSVVLGILAGIALVIAGVAALVTPDKEGADPEQLAVLSDRIKPVTQVVTDPAALLKVTAKPARAPLAAEQVLAQVSRTPRHQPRDRDYER